MAAPGLEIIEDAGVAGAIAERSTPAANMAATGFYAGLTGPTEDCGRRIARLECRAPAARTRAGAPRARGVS